MSKINGPIVAGAVALGLVFAQPAASQTAQTSQSAAARAAAANPEYQALFKRMYANPSDLDTTFKFAELAAKLGDYEAAIGALERMLYYNPNLPRVKLELGVLYTRIGGHKIARGYFEQALATPGIPPDVQQRVAAMMNDIDQRITPHKFGGFLHAGYRYQTNASAGPNDLTVRAAGVPAQLNGDAASAPDWNKFATGGVFYNYEFSDALWFESSALGYYAKQEHLSKFDLSIVEAQVGPRFAVPLINGSMKVYGIGTLATLAEDRYYAGPGVGVSARFPVGQAARFEASYEYRDRQYKNSPEYPTSEQFTGKLQTAAIAGEGTLFGFLPWMVRIAGDWNRTDRAQDNFNSYNRISADIGFPIGFMIPWVDRQAVFTPGAGVSQTNYLEPDPAVDPVITRRDKEWHVSGSLDVQVYNNWGIRTQVYYTRTDSSLPNFELDNFAVSVGPSVRF